MCGKPARKTYKPIRETAMSRADLSTLQDSAAISTDFAPGSDRMQLIVRLPPRMGGQNGREMQLKCPQHETPPACRTRRHCARRAGHCGCPRVDACRVCAC